MPKKLKANAENPIIIYQDSKNTPAISLLLEDETLWLTQRQIAELFGVTKQAINQHINNIFEEEELLKSSTVKFFLIVQNEGNRQVSRELEHYNLDMIISVGYRVNSKNATKFRQWASGIIFERVDSNKPNIGLTNFKGKMPTKKESEIAKNYLYKNEIEALNKIVSAYFEFAEMSALNKETKTMQGHLEKLNEFLRLSWREILENSGTISHKKSI